MLKGRGHVFLHCECQTWFQSRSLYCPKQQNSSQKSSRMCPGISVRRKYRIIIIIIIIIIIATYTTKINVPARIRNERRMWVHPMQVVVVDWLITCRLTVMMREEANRSHSPPSRHQSCVILNESSSCIKETALSMTSERMLASHKHLFST